MTIGAPGVGGPAGSTRRAAPAGNRDADALAVLAALATTAVLLSVGELATALTWDLDRTAAASEHAADRPPLAGPVALRRVPP
ncbi:hypothetical protein [Actinoplanes xinjiangensis]|uniref:hypothetical protein n=1 Tax=Actinoplanes xinjiangensis TaxID=512350 RepID=UPI003414424A